MPRLPRSFFSREKLRTLIEASLDLLPNPLGLVPDSITESPNLHCPALVAQRDRHPLRDEKTPIVVPSAPTSYGMVSVVPEVPEVLDRRHDLPRELVCPVVMEAM